MRHTSPVEAERLLREMAEYVGFASGDLLRLRKIFPRLEPDLSIMAQVFYESIQRNPDARAFLTSSGVPMERLQGTLREWARTLLTQDRDGAYAISRLSIGQRHVQIGLQQKYVLGAINVVRTFLQSRLDGEGPGGESAAIRTALHRAIDLDMNLICEAYFAGRLDKKEEERQQVQQRLDDFMDIAPVFVVGVDLQGRITMFNRKCEEGTGWRRQEVLGRDFSSTFLPERVRGRAMEELQQTFERGVARVVEHPLLTRDGAERLVRWFSVVTRDASGRVVDRVAIGHDITELVALQRQATEQEKSATLGLLAAGMAHEVGNPLNSILAVVQGLLRRTAEPAVREDLRLVVEEVSRVTRLLRQMVQLAKPVRHRQEPVQIRDVVASVLEVVRFDPRARACTFQTELHHELPETWGYRDDLAQLLLNLLLNAIDAVASKTGVIRVTAEYAAGEIQIEIADNGCGIAAEHLPRIFEPFFTTKESGRGTGLGLWVSRRIAQEHGGDLTVEGRPGEGARVKVRLPVRPRAG